MPLLLAGALAGCAPAGGVIRAGDAPATTESAPGTAPRPAALPPTAPPGPAGAGEVSPPPTRNPAVIALARQADAERASGDYQRAAATLERAVRVDPGDAASWIALGEVRLLEGRPGQAEALALKALSLTRDPALAAEARALAERARRAGTGR